MSERDELGERFEAQRRELTSMAYRMLGSLSEAEDAVQESWFRLERVDTREVRNLAAWLRRVVSHVCLDMLRARAARREDALMPGGLAEPHAELCVGADPESEMLLADAVGRALLVVMDRLAPDERVALVLHEMAGLSFEEVAPIVGRTVGAAKKLASRARQKLRGTSSLDGADLAGQQRVVAAFVAAARSGDLDSIRAVLAADVVRHADAAAVGPGRATEVRGADDVSREIVGFGRNARFAALALVDGSVGLVVAPLGRLTLAIRFTVAGSRIAAYELVADPTRLAGLDLALIGDTGSTARAI